jgi:hypothetical protein
MRVLATKLVLLLFIPAAAASGENYLYRAEMVQAAPGKILELIDLYRTHVALTVAGGDPAPLWMRHSQGDRWDLLLLYPMGAYTEFYSAERVARRKKAEDSSPGLAGRIRQEIAWHEDLFVYGAPLETLRAAFDGAKFFHVEMIRALAGRQADLYKEREMESAYQKFLNRPELFIFVRDRGAAWDLFSIDFYRDIKHYAESADISAEKQLTAARAAGYADADQIGPNFRAVIADHHDTLAVALAPIPSK